MVLSIIVSSNKNMHMRKVLETDDDITELRWAKMSGSLGALLVVARRLYVA